MGHINMDAYKKYKATAAVSTEGIGAVITVFDEVIKLLYNAKQCQQNQDFEGEYKNLSKSADVFNLMRAGVDIENGGEIAQKLDSFYAATARKIEEINLKNSPFTEIERLIEVVRSVRDTIQEVDAKNSNN
jgi:flagellar protein FliS